jgi:hypothetical protein
LPLFGILTVKRLLVEIAKVMCKFPWMVDVVRQRPMTILHPYMVEVYVTKDGSETRLSHRRRTAPKTARLGKSG